METVHIHEEQDTKPKIDRMQYLLIKMMEECAEVQQILSKILIFGLYDAHPHVKDAPMNMQCLRQELNDLFAVLEMAEDEGLPFWFDADMMAKKKAKVEEWMLYSKEKGLH